MTHCPVCSHEYVQSDFVLVGEQAGKTTFHVTCTQCKSSLFIVMQMKSFGVLHVGILTDLSSQEVKQFFSQETISADQVLDTHAFLEKYEGGVQELTAK